MATTVPKRPRTSLVTPDDGARRWMRLIRHDIFYAFSYNAIGIVLAMRGHITPLIAAIMMPMFFHCRARKLVAARLRLT